MTLMSRKWPLLIQPVPKNNWGDNLSHILPKDIWDHLRREVYRKESSQCQICGDTTVVLHCHENWGYDDHQFTQTLLSLMCLCKTCHDSIHWFRTEKQVITKQGKDLDYPIDYLNTLKIHFLKVNGCSYRQFLFYVSKLHRIRDLRSRHDYKLVYGKWDPERIVKLWNHQS